jgi:hypothetical protein
MSWPLEASGSGAGVSRARKRVPVTRALPCVRHEHLGVAPTSMSGADGRTRRDGDAACGSDRAIGSCNSVTLWRVCPHLVVQLPAVPDELETACPRSNE